MQFVFLLLHLHLSDCCSNRCDSIQPFAGICRICRICRTLTLFRCFLRSDTLMWAVIEALSSFWTSLKFFVSFSSGEERYQREPAHDETPERIFAMTSIASAGCMF
jgi:hypothetical protein